MIDDKLSRRILIAAGILGALAIAVGAFGSHQLPKFLVARRLDSETIERRVDQFDTAARYHLIHAVAIMVVSTIPYGTPMVRKIVAGLFIAGIVLFSGSLYVLVLTNTPKMGAITPIGGVFWIAAWLSLVFVAQKRKAVS